VLLPIDVPGVLDKSKKPIRSCGEGRRKLTPTAFGGMIPKVETCTYALEQGRASSSSRQDATVPLRMFTNQGTGTIPQG
jgi:acetylglutamate kinase